MRLGRLVTVGALGTALLLGGCGAQDHSLVPVPLPVTPSAAAARASTTPAPTLPIPSGAAVALDPTLLAVLPSAVGGVAVRQEPDSFAETIKDPSFVASVDRAVFPIVVSGGDLASGVVAHVRPGVYSDKMFGDWRSSYEEGACAPASGVVAHAEQTSGGNTIYVTTCGGGLRVYQTYLASRGVIVSLFSTGTQDFGGQLMGGIRR